MSEVTEWQYVCILRAHFITKMSLLATQSDWSVCAGCGGGQWCIFCWFLLFLRIKTSHETYIPIDERRERQLQVSQKCKNDSLSICSWAFHLDQGEEAVDHCIPASPQGELCFLQPSCLVEWSGKAMRVKVRAIWRAHQARLHVQLSRLCRWR